MNIQTNFNTEDNRWEILFIKDKKYIGLAIPPKYNDQEDLIKLLVSSFQKILKAFDENG